MNKNWNYSNIIDLEYFIGKDAGTPDAELHERDRQFFLELDQKEENELLPAWLDAQRKTDQDQPLPGTMARDAYRLARTILFLIALMSGAGSGLVYFSYSGATPVNVLPFFALFVILQVLLAFFIFFRQGISRILKKSLPESATSLLLSALAARFFRSLISKTKQTIPAEQLLSMQALWGKGRQKKSSYQSLFYWPMFGLLQAAGIIFNIGLLAATFIKVSISDIAFGWQSTLQFSAQSLHETARIVAIPWSWFLGEGSGYPTLADVEGSRIILKEGIANLATANLISWWPFLLMSVLVYGLLLRAGLYLYGKHMQNRAESTFLPDTPAAIRIIRRMQTPLVTTQAEIETTTEEKMKGGEQQEEEPVATSRTQKVDILLPDECYNQCSMEELRELLQKNGFLAGTIHRYLVDYNHDQQVLQRLTNNSELGGIIIFMEAWMPPLMDFLSFLQQLRKEITANTLIRVTLLGKPVADTIFTPVSNDTHKRVWKQKLESLGDPYLEITTVEGAI